MSKTVAWFIFLLLGCWIRFYKIHDSMLSFFRSHRFVWSGWKIHRVNIGVTAADYYRIYLNRTLCNLTPLQVWIEWETQSTLGFITLATRLEFALSFRRHMFIDKYISPLKSLSVSSLLSLGLLSPLSCFIYDITSLWYHKSGIDWESEE